MKKFYPNLPLIGFLILYGLVTLYTLTFPTTLSWFVFYTFTLFLALSYLSTRLYLLIEDVQWEKSESNQTEIQVTLRTLGRIPFFLPAVTCLLKKERNLAVIQRSAFFTRHLHLTFHTNQLPRGRHMSLELTLKGKGLFGMFRYQATKEIPVSIDIYPELLPKSSRANLLKQMSSILTHFDRSPIHEFQVREIRPFQDRDSLSDMDWKSSIKRNQWMIKEYDPEDTTPIGIYFLGASSPHFEELLSMTYSLYKDLILHQHALLFLCGTFEEHAKVKHTEEDFLFIQPVEETQKLKQLWQKISSHTGDKVIITPKDYPFSEVSTKKGQSILITDDVLTKRKES